MTASSVPLKLAAIGGQAVIGPGGGHVGTFSPDHPSQEAHSVTVYLGRQTTWIVGAGSVASSRSRLPVMPRERTVLTDEQFFAFLNDRDDLTAVIHGHAELARLLD